MGINSDSIRGKIVVGVIVAISVAAIMGAIQWVWPKFLHGLIGLLNQLGVWLGSTSLFPNWAVYSLAIIAVCAAIDWATRFMPRNIRHFTEYIKDVFDGIPWRWSYINNTPSNLKCYCPECDTELVSKDVYKDGGLLPYIANVHFGCEKCDEKIFTHTGNKKSLLEKISREIDRVIRTNEWQTKVKPPNQPLKRTTAPSGR